VVFVGGAWFLFSLRAPGTGKSVYYRVSKPTELSVLLTELEAKQFVTSARAAGWFARLRGYPPVVRTGTYRIGRSMTAKALVESFQRKIRQMVRVPETNWAARTANILAKAQVCSASDYLTLVKSPDEFQLLVPFPLPTDSLEGYLYPDTYDFPPLLGAREVILRQLANFTKKVWEPMKHPKDLHELLTIGSLVEMEVRRDEERAKVSSVIHNRQQQGMPLQIDAAINYALQKWRPLRYSDYRGVDSPYNLYRHKGLPPGPICSPTLPSIVAAANPSKDKNLYYVAMPSGETMFAVEYDDHLKNVAKRRHAIAGAATR